jgi:hypothetical protein
MSRVPRQRVLGPVQMATAGVAAIAVGYADLWRGGTTLAAVALVLGYVVLLPLALLAVARDAPATDPVEEAPPYGAAIAVGGAVLLLYALTLAPTTAMWDTSEYLAAARVLGIPHPPGNPLFVLVAHAFALLPLPLEYAARVNLLAATTSAASAALWFLVTHRALRGWDLTRGPRVAIAAAATWLGATAFTVWNQSVVNEKVYTLAMLGVAAVAWLALRWHDAPAGSRRADALLVLIAYLCGLGYANHPAGFLPLPAVGLFVLLRRPATLLRWRMLVAAALMLGVGLTPFAFQPIRAAHDPPINVGRPTACTDGPQLACTLTGETWDRLLANVRREQYGGHRVAERQAPLGAQLGMWWLYFRWQWLRDVAGAMPGAQALLALLFLGLGLGGAVVHARRDRGSFAFVAPLVFTLTPALVVYLNFKYGWSQAPELQGTVPREVRDRDYFYLWSFATWAIWAGLGLGAAWQAAARLASGRGGLPASRGWWLASPVLLLALVPFVGNLGAAPRRGETFTREWAHDLLQSVEPYAILVTNGDNDSFPLWYAQHVEGIRRDVTLAVVPYLGTDWFVRQLLRERVAPYDGSGLPAYAALAGAPPTAAPMTLTAAEADAIPQVVQLPGPQRFAHHGIDATIPAGILRRDHLVVLRMVADAFPARPVYFSLGGYARELGLDDYVVTQGLAQRLLTSPARDNPAYVPYGGGFLDLERSRALWATYRGPEALLRQRRWVDDASAGIPAAYAVTAQLVARGLAARGDSAGAVGAMRQATEIAAVAGLLR